jgi:transposase-like protein
LTASKKGGEVSLSKITHQGTRQVPERLTAMGKITRLVLWLCKKFTRQDLEDLVAQLQQVLAGREPELQPRDDFRQQHPHYRDFYVDPQAPLTQPPSAPAAALTLDWQQLCAAYLREHGRSLSPVRRRGTQPLPRTCRCAHCGAPPEFLYLNDGRQASQLLCKVCGRLSQLAARHRLTRPARYWCPYCHSALYCWKQRPDCTIYKCPCDQCPHYLQKQQALKWNEKLLQKLRLSQFKLRYQYREYHFQPAQLAPSAPHRPTVDLTRIHRSSDLLGLVLAFHISFALSARKTAHVLRQVFGVPLSYQSVLNYAQAAAYYCHAFNLRHKAPLSDTATGDETYIRVAGKHQYTFFFLDPQGHHITSYHVASERDALAATVALGEAARTLPQDQALRFITDGNPAYQAGVHFLNAHRSPSQPPHTLRQVIGLENRDEVSTEFRPFKQLVERLNRTYKHHVRPACGFATPNGAVALTTLFVTHYNFLRPHSTLGYQVPIPLPELSSVTTLQGKWNKILQQALAT